MHMKNHIYVFPTSISVYLKSSAHTTNFTSNPEVHSNVFPFHICNTFLWEWETWLPLSSIHLHISSMSMTVASLLTPADLHFHLPALPWTASSPGCCPAWLPSSCSCPGALTGGRPTQSLPLHWLQFLSAPFLTQSLSIGFLELFFFYALISIEIVTDIQ